MKTVLIIISFVLLGCTEKTKESEKHGDVDYGLSVVNVNGCQYVIYSGSYKAAMVHAGNCNNHK